MTNTFVSRWGIPELDDYRWLNIPGFIMRNWSKFVSIQEWSFILQVMSFKYDSANGQASPSLETITEELGYKNIRSVQIIKKKLADKNLLEITERPGLTDIYDFKKFAQKCHIEEVNHNSLVNQDSPVPPYQDSPGVVHSDSPEESEDKNQNYKKQNSLHMLTNFSIETIMVLASLLHHTDDDTDSAIVEEAKQVIREESNKKRRRLFDGVAKYSFGIDTKKPEAKVLLKRKGTAKRIGKIESWLKELHKERNFKDEDAQANELWKFFKYWEKKYSDASPPRDADKFAEHYTAYLQSDELNNYRYNNTRMPDEDDYAVPEAANADFNEDVLREMGIIQ